MLVKLTPGVNFTNISKTFSEQFLWKIVFEAFLQLLFGFVIFCLKNIGTKAPHKMFVKFTAGENWQKFDIRCWPHLATSSVVRLEIPLGQYDRSRTLLNWIR